MLIIWRGAGIIVPIFFFISAWLTSYSFEDTRFGNAHYMGWTLLWSGIALFLTGGLLAAANIKDPETAEKPEKSRHDFFWLPVWIWGIFFIGLSIWLINKGGEDSQVMNDPQDERQELIAKDSGERTIHFNNPTADTVRVEVFTEDGTLYMDEKIPALNTRYLSYDAGKYVVKFNGTEWNITVEGTAYENGGGYDDYWFLAGPESDLILVEVTEACRSDINETELREIDWTSRTKRRYTGWPYFEAKIDSRQNTEPVFYGPSQYLPVELKENQVAYALIRIPTDTEVTEVYLDSAIVAACFD